MKKLLLILLITFTGLCLNAQNFDSLYTVWQDVTQADSNRAKAYSYYIAKGFLFSNPDTAFILAQDLLRFGEEKQYNKAKAAAYKIMGVSNALKTDHPKALKYFKLNWKISKEIGNKMGSAGAINNIGIIYYGQGDYPKALEYYLRSLTILEEIGNKEVSISVINNIGTIYDVQGDFPKALEYFQRCLKVQLEIGDKQGSATTINNIGSVYKQQGDYPKALDFYKRSLKINNENEFKLGSANVLNNIGSVYQLQNNFPLSLEYYQSSLEISKEMGDKNGSANVLNFIGMTYKELENYPKALEYCKMALVTGEELGLPNLQKNACQCLYETYKAFGKGNDALVYLEKIQVIEDSLDVEETGIKLQQMEFAKQVFADSMASLEKERLVEEAHQAEVQKKNKTRNGLLIGGVFFVLLAGGFYSRWRFTKKAKAEVELEKDRSDNLLLNILPADIAEELKIKGKADARDFNMVSILFTDFKGFTSASEKMSAKDLVASINQCFEAFDGICEKHQVEKIKTIGDAYMAAGGLPVPTDDSVKNTVLAALEMQSFITQLHKEKEAKGEHAFQMRVGIHTGPVVAGIVGVKKFQYDIWGDTVNTASRMESNGDIGKVNISQTTYELLKKDPDFSFENRGKIEAKGKGEIDMYFVSEK